MSSDASITFDLKNDYCTRCGNKLEDVVFTLKSKLKSDISKSSMVGSDETSVHVNGKKDWIWVWQNTSNTWMLASENRGSSTVDSVWKIGLLDSILVSDRLAAQLKTPSGGNQICLAHLLRDLTYLKEAEKRPFAK